MRSVFAIVVTLLKDGFVESNDQISYLPIRDCNAKFIVRLLYSSRPFNSSATHSVRIQTFDKKSLVYRAAWLYSIPFSFLPVYRIVTILWMPSKYHLPCSHKCNNHGICTRYDNVISSTYCRCDPGWTGNDCNETHDACKRCSSDSLCVDSVCVCRVAKFGSRCYLIRSSCEPNPCMNGGLCVPSDERISEHNFTCICKEEFSGETCQFTNSLITISLRQIDQTIPPTMLLHFIRSFNMTSAHKQWTIIKKIAVYEDTVNVYSAEAFHIVFGQFFSSYYLVSAQEGHHSANHISVLLAASDRCRYIDEVFNLTIVNMHILRRVKLYHVPCEKQTELRCFYDNTFMCLCNLRRQANCFHFNYATTHKCLGYQFCENNASCFQDQAECPLTSMCGCPKCFIGSRCQFPTKGFTLSLDIILGPYIQPNVSFGVQSVFVKMSTLGISIMWILGMISGLFSILTFKDKVERRVGCVFYLLGSAVTSVVIMTFLIIKFVLLILSQMAFITSYPMLQIYCLSVDFLLSISLNSNNWLNASVAIERVVMAKKGVHFKKSSSIYAAKYVIILIILLVIASTLQDPFHRRLFEDEEDKRVWCVVDYSFFWQTVNSAMVILHIVGPFSINFCSALFIIVIISRQRNIARDQATHKQQVKVQFWKHKHLLISPSVLTILSLPRLIFAFLPGCLQTSRNPSILLAGYFVPYIPPTLTFFVFVLPSEKYKAAFSKALKSIGRKFRVIGSH